MMTEYFGKMPDGQEAWLYTISCGKITAAVTDCGAALVRLLVPDAAGNTADVILGYDSAEGYLQGDTFQGAIVGRSANRIAGATIAVGGKAYALDDNENGNNLHSGPDFFHLRLWQVEHHNRNSITLRLDSPDGDQGYPGNATIRVTYRLDEQNALHIIYDALCDKDTIFNLTNHSYFNLAGWDKPEKCMDQLLTLPARFFTAADAASIPTGEKRNVAGTPMDFRSPKPIGRDIDAVYDALQLQGGYDHNYEVFCDPCAILTDPDSGRTMAVTTDCPGIQFYAGNYLTGQPGKGGLSLSKRSGICLETQYYPDAIHHPEWPQPVTKAGEKYHSETIYRFL